jgi:hypothetical protein
MPQLRNRFILPSHRAALRLGRTQALMVLELPAGFHSLPIEAKRQLVQVATEDALVKAFRCIDLSSMESASVATPVSKNAGFDGTRGDSEATAA